jgi:hypothetical protein
MENKKILKLAVIAAVIFMVTSSTPVFNVVGDILGLDYENTDDNHRHMLLVIHAAVTGALMFLVVKYCGKLCGV